MKTLGEKIRWLRLKRNCKQYTLAEALGISAAAMSKIETDLTDLSVSKLTLIATFFELSPGALLDDEEPGTNANAVLICSLKDELLLAEQRLVKLQGRLIELYERHAQ
ncbi:transcriptional regulator with XRE-family HTH domain [Pedobacter sp. AK017]|uniref:helix-turn-helix domain-containing protein n=1 Tax=Pedobacter sp. AK017 TaxID=2723073 RepID=UPI001614C2D4|nr:helix-turn-helix transcriptional regulator [Pedobacter sp. AK017]MBB5437265.1 transcriptional regulator with XRE-family HTH domain [Pedobacter sp. AK017]